MLVVAFSLVAAISYGFADFVGGAASKRTSPWAVALVVQLAAALALLVLGLVLGGTPNRGDWGWGLAGGLFNGLGTAFLYRGLSAGRMGVVAPVSGVGAAALPVLVGLLTGERPPALVWLGIVVAFPGIWLVAREPGPPTTAGGQGSTDSGLLDGLLAGLGFGALFACLAQLPEEAGYLPLALNQAAGGVTVVAVAMALGVAWLPRQPAALWGVVSGLLAAVATGAFLLATQTGYLTVAAVVSSLYPAVTVVLAALLLRERVHGGQAGGLVLCLAAVALVATG